MTIQNLPRAVVYKNDSNTLDKSTESAPSVLIIGTSGKGVGDEVVLPGSLSLGKSEFGSEGSLIRGMWEANKAGATQIKLYRIGATAAVLSGVGDTTGAAGMTITTIEKDADAGANYALWYDDTTNRIVIIRTSDELVIYDNDPGNEIDKFEVSVSGSKASTGGGDIGSPSGYVNLEDVTTTGTTFVAGTDGLSLSKMELYEKLYTTYKNLLDEQFDIVVPMEVFSDDYNIIDQGHYLGSVLPIIPGAQTYPTAGAYELGTDVDSLGTVFVEEYYGEFYFWWRTTTGTFTAAEIYPSVGSATATTKIDGTALTADDFHEVNFAYQLGRFLYDYTTDIVDATGVIGCLPPASTALSDKARWIGKAPTWTQNTQTELYYIASSSDNGYGLLGNKFQVGKSDYRSGIFGGGMILTDSEFIDGAEMLDSNDIPIDLGKYVSIVADSLWLRNNWYNAGYISSFAASYAGFYLNRPPASSPTNKALPSGMDQIYKHRLGYIDALSGAGYVATRKKVTGELAIADAPMATMPNSDWRRLSTVRIAKAVIDGLRIAADPFLGEGMSDGAKASLQKDLDQVLLNSKKIGYVKDYGPIEILQTPSMEVLGQATVNLRMKPAFELRFIEFTVNIVKTV